MFSHQFGFQYLMPGTQRGLFEEELNNYAAAAAFASQQQHQQHFHQQQYVSAPFGFGSGSTGCTPIFMPSYDALASQFDSAESPSSAGVESSFVSEADLSQLGSASPSSLASSIESNIDSIPYMDQFEGSNPEMMSYTAAAQHHDFALIGQHPMHGKKQSRNDADAYQQSSFGKPKGIEKQRKTGSKPKKSGSVIDGEKFNLAVSHAQASDSSSSDDDNETV